MFYMQVKEYKGAMRLMLKCTSGELQQSALNSIFQPARYDGV